VFPYSKRPGTPAAKMPGQVANALKEERAHRAADVAGRMEQDYLAQFMGTTLPVLFEEEKDGLWRGHTPNYIPVAVKSECLHNQVREVLLEREERGTLFGTLI